MKSHSRTLPPQDCQNPCCNASTCQLVPGAECGQGTCCQNCRVSGLCPAPAHSPTVHSFLPTTHSVPPTQSLAPYSRLYPLQSCPINSPFNSHRCPLPSAIPTHNHAPETTFLASSTPLTYPQPGPQPTPDAPNLRHSHLPSPAGGSLELGSGEILWDLLDQVKAAGELCRPAKDQCDLEEHCDGLGPECPEDAFQENGTPCPWGHCYNGDCPSLARMCQNLWGPGEAHSVVRRWGGVGSLAQLTTLPCRCPRCHGQMLQPLHRTELQGQLAPGCR